MIGSVLIKSEHALFDFMSNEKERFLKRSEKILILLWVIDWRYIEFGIGTHQHAIIAFRSHGYGYFDSIPCEFRPADRAEYRICPVNHKPKVL
jgi:hypothetical protein